MIVFKLIRDPYRREYIALALKTVKNILGNYLISFVLYGSVARWDDERSDVDVLMVLDSDISYSKRCYIFSKILTELYRSKLAQK
ncbi:MAG: hypothetical protein QXS74_07760 [Nitrososphaeria archaeon]